MTKIQDIFATLSSNPMFIGIDFPMLLERIKQYAQDELEYGTGEGVEGEQCISSYNQKGFQSETGWTISVNTFHRFISIMRWDESGNTEFAIRCLPYDV